MPPGLSARRGNMTLRCSPAWKWMEGEDQDSNPCWPGGNLTCKIEDRTVQGNQTLYKPSNHATHNAILFILYFCWGHAWELHHACGFLVLSVKHPKAAGKPGLCQRALMPGTPLLPFCEQKEQWDTMANPPQCVGKLNSLMWGQGWDICLQYFWTTGGSFSSRWSFITVIVSGFGI